jgi:hypothetical protein
MKKILLLILFFLNFSYFCYSQKDEKLKQAEAIQIAYLTKELGLTPEEAEKFWPVFNNYKGEIKRTKAENPGDVVATEEKILNVKRKYQGEFKKVLSDDKRVNKIFSADQKFRDLLKRELDQRNNKQLSPDKELKQRGKKFN